MGGPTQVVLNLVRTLRQLGVDTEIVTTNDNGAELLDVPLCQRVEYQQVPVWFFPRAPWRIRDYLFAPNMAPWLWQNLRQYDLLETHYLFTYAPSCAATIAQLQKVPYLVRTMGQLTPWALAQGRLKKQAYSWLMERRILQQAAAIHCTASGEAEDVRNFGIQTPAVTLPLGVDPPQAFPNATQQLRQRYGITRHVPIILFLSRLHYKKRPDLLLAAAAELARQNYGFHLVFAGTGTADYIAELKARVAALGLDQQVTFTGLVVGAEKDLLLRGSSLFVLPSFSENFGIAIAEAMSAELPVIITPGIQIAEEIAAARAGLVVDGEVKAVAAAIAQLLDSPKLRQQLGRNGRQLVEQRYSWTKIASDLALVYKTILHDRSLPESLAIGSVTPASQLPTQLQQSI